MNVIRRTILLELGLCFSMGLLSGCTTGATDTRKQNAIIDRLAQCEAEFRQGKTDQALQTASEAISVTPDRAEAWNTRGFVYASKGLMGQALNDFTQAVRLHPANVTYLSNLGVAHLESGEADQALVAFDNALQVESPSARALKHRGIAYRHLGKLQDALHDFNTAVRLERPGCDDLCKSCCRVCASAGLP